MSVSKSGRKFQGRRGVSLGTVLLCMVALTLILLTAATAAVSHLRFATAQENTDHARNLAEAALAETLTRLIETDFAFGKDGKDGTVPARIEVTIPDLPGASGVVTFDTGELGFLRGYSLNNTETDAAVAGAGGITVPGRAVHVLARGRSGTAERWVECVYYRPPFPDGLVCTGIADARSVFMAAVRQTGAYVGGDPRAIPAEDVLPANIFSNSRGRAGRPGVVVSGVSTVTGSVGAVGRVQVDPGCDIGGEILPNSEFREIPDLRLDEKFSIVEENNSLVSSSAGNLTLEPNFFVRAEGGLQVGGDLDMNGSVLLVKGGDLRVSGGIKGTGIILGERDIEIRDGRTNLESSEQVAIGCRGSFRLRAEAPENNYFHGLIYAEGDIEAKDITVVGAVVGNGQGGRNGDVTLDNVRFVYDPSVLRIVAFPPLITAREWDDNVLFSAAGATVRPNEEGNGWLVDAWVGMQTQVQDKDRLKRLKPTSDERGVDERQWSIEELKALSPSTFVEKTWKGIQVPDVPLADPDGMYAYYGGEPFKPDQDLALRQSHAYSVAMREVATWLDARSGLDGSKGNSWWDRMSSGFQLNKNGSNPNRPPEDGTVHILQIVNSFRKADTARKESKVVHFHLNNLLAELTANTSRVLIWRPVERR